VQYINRSYRCTSSLWDSKLDDEALADIRPALTQGQALGVDRLSEKICGAAGIRHTQKVRGRLAENTDQAGDVETKNEF
jgi:hypothetical protein